MSRFPKLSNWVGKVLLTEIGKTLRLGNVARAVDNDDAVNLAQLNEGLAAAGSVSDVAYNATTWNDVTTISPSKNAVRDQVEIMLTSIEDKLPLGGGTLIGALFATTIQTAAGGGVTKAIAIGGPGTGIWRDTGLDGLKILINNVDTLWLGDSVGVVAKSGFKTESTFVNGGTPQTLTGAGDVSLGTYTTLLVTTGADALTLADGTEGQHKYIQMKTFGGNGILTPTNLRSGTTITFANVDEFVHLFFIDGQWSVLRVSGAVVA